MTVIISYFCGFYFNYGFKGIVLGVGMGQAVGFIIYLLSYFLNPTFKEYHKAKSDINYSDIIHNTVQVPYIAICYSTHFLKTIANNSIEYKILLFYSENQSFKTG